MEQISLDAYIVDSLMPDLVGHDRQPAAFLVYLYLCRQCGDDAPHRQRSLREVSEGTGLSKRAVQEAISRLVKRELIGVERESPTAVPKYAVHRPWSRYA